jgi:outer membrane protein assembly factor BamB
MARIIASVVLVTLATVGFAADKALVWPQFRGTGGSGIAEDQKPPVEFGPDKNVKWKVPAPGGLSSPIVAGDLLVFTAFDGGKLYTVAFNRADGKEAWRKEAPAKEIEAYFKADGSPAASTPVTDGERIVSYFGSCGLFCYDLTGKELWRYELPMAKTVADFGSGTSPILVGGSVVLVRDEAKDPKIIAIDVATGSRKWEKPRKSMASFSTPLVLEASGGTQIVTAGHGRLIAYDLKTGDEKWTVNGMPSSPCTTPIAADGVVYFAGWAPGEPGDKEFQLPPFDVMHKQAAAKDKDSIIRAEAEKTFFKDFFDATDANKDGKVTREEWDAVLKFMAEGKNSAFAVKTGGAGDVSATHVLWKKTKGLPYVPTGIVYQGQFVMVKDGGLVSAYDAKSGKEIYTQEREAAAGRYFASAVAANGHIYLTAFEDGTITVLKGGADKATVVAKNPKLGERVGATPAIADDTLYVRTAGHLYAFAVKK